MYKILLIGDHIFCNQVKYINSLSNQDIGIKYKETNNIIDAVKTIKTSTYDIIILFENDTKNRELEFIKKWKELHLTSYIIVIGKGTNYVKIRRALLLGVFDYIISSSKEIELPKTLKRCKEHINENRKNDNLIYIKDAMCSSIMKEDTDVFDESYTLFLSYINECGSLETTATGTLILDTAKFLYQYTTKKYTWISKFIKSYPYFKEKILSYNDRQSIILFFEKYIKEMIGVLKMFYPVNSKERTQEICRYILEHSDKKITLSEVANYCYLNKTYLSHVFKVEMKMSFIEYITIMKILRATKLIKERNCKVFEIADQLGFDDVEYFGKKFKKIVGVTPKVYMMKIQKNEIF